MWFWSKKAFSDALDCNLYWDPATKLWFRYGSDDDFSANRYVVDVPVSRERLVLMARDEAATTTDEGEKFGFLTRHAPEDPEWDFDGTELTYPEKDLRSLFLGKQLDHIFVRGLGVTKVEAVAVESSDHNPVFAVLRYPP